MKRPARKLVTVIAVVSAFVVTMASPGVAATVAPPIATGFAGPLQIAVNAKGQIFVAQDFAGVLTRVDPDGTRTDLVTAPGEEIVGVSVAKGKVTFTQNVGDMNGFTSALLKRLLPSGRVVTLADLGQFERTRNPDRHRTYGFRHLAKACAAQLPAELGPAKYKGIVDSHPYATLARPDGSTYVADAAGNDILRVSASGRIHVVTVLPPVPAVVTADGAAALGLPDCTLGKTYWFEPVPTDVEMGPDGALYVSLLPGGPEDPSLGARGRVYRVNPHSGHVRLVAKGFLGATNLAVSRSGKIYVTELFGGQVSQAVGGSAQPVVSLPPPAALEWSHGKLYAGYDAFGDGAVGTITP